jgi:hypothetical protein
MSDYTLQDLINDIQPDTGSTTKHRISFEAPSNDELWVVAEEHKPDSSYGDAVTYKFKLTDK